MATQKKSGPSCGGYRMSLSGPVLELHIASDMVLMPGGYESRWAWSLRDGQTRLACKYSACPAEKVRRKGVSDDDMVRIDVVKGAVGALARYADSPEKGIHILHSDRQYDGLFASLHGGVTGRWKSAESVMRQIAVSLAESGRAWTFDYTPEGDNGAEAALVRKSKGRSPFRGRCVTVERQEHWDRAIKIGVSKNWSLTRVSACFKSLSGIYPDKAGVTPVWGWDDRDELISVLVSRSRSESAATGGN
jgi:hypothetical protein